MYEGFSIWSFLSGLPLGLLIAGIIFYFSWRKGKKERRYDERYTRIHEQARSISWIVTYFTILILWAFVLIMEKPGLAFFVLTGLYVIQMVSYVIGSIIATRKN